jgi:hypothetical protein
MQKKRSKPKQVAEIDPAIAKDSLKLFGGSESEDFNIIVFDQARCSLWTKHSDDTMTEHQFQATAAAMMGIAPRDELEGMLAAQLIAAHNATMECFRRAMIPELSFDGRKEALNQADKLARTYTMLLEALNRHRGKGTQKVTVEHVHVHEGGQAIVGAVEAGGGVASGNQRLPHAQGAIAHAPVAPVWSEDPEQEPVPLTGDAER